VRLHSVEASDIARTPARAGGARRPFIVGIGGTTRPSSSCEAALLYALDRAAARGAETEAFTGASLALPIFDPQSPVRSDDAARLVAALRRADGVIIASPGYHGLISGMLKNALDYTEDMRADARPYLDGRAVGCIVSANGAQALGSTLASLRSMIHALRGWPTPYGATLVSGAVAFERGVPTDAANRAALETVADQVADFAWMSLAWSPRAGAAAAVLSA
jgi:FMN reductase